MFYQPLKVETGRILAFFFILLFVPFLSFGNPPPAKDVFQLKVQQVDPNTFSINWDIKTGFFLYKTRIKIIETPDNNFNIGTLNFPEALRRTDARGKIHTIYRNNLTLSVPILGENPGEALLGIQYQGCSDDGFCYPPETAQVKLTIDANLALTNVTIETNAHPSSDETINQKDHLGKLFSSQNWGFIILSFFGFGLLLSFTPCVLPMIPVLSGIIVGHSQNISTSKAFFLSLSYVLSMSVTYAVIGAVVALMGNNLQIAMQSPWAISLFSLIFILLALSMFNFYELRMPLSWQAKFANITRSQSSGHYLGAAIMGCLSTLILSPCVTAPLIGALGYIAQTGNIGLGSMSLFFLGLGMGTPLLLIGTSAGKLLPRAGSWMNAVKSFFGIMLLAVAIYLMDRILPASLIMVSWAALAIFSGIFMGALTKSESNKARFSQGLGIILLVYGLLILIGTSQGNRNPLQPLATTHQVDSQKNPMVVAKSLTELQQALIKAKGKPVMLDFYADWCTSCKVLDHTTLQDPRILSLLTHFTVIRADITENNAETNKLLNQYEVVAPPTFLFFNAAGKELPDLQLVGEISPDTLCANLNMALSND